MVANAIFDTVAEEEGAGEDFSVEGDIRGAITGGTADDGSTAAGAGASSGTPGPGCSTPWSARRAATASGSAYGRTAAAAGAQPSISRCMAAACHSHSSGASAFWNGVMARPSPSRSDRVAAAGRRSLHGRKG